MQPLEEGEGVADVFLWGRPHRITEARAYFRLKHVASWCALVGRQHPITLHPWEDWDHLGDRLSVRLGHHLWHPSHWDAYYETLPDVPASVHGTVPVSAKREEVQTTLFSEA